MWFIKTFDQHPNKSNIGFFFSSPVKLSDNLNLKLSSEFDHGFVNHVCLHSAFLKALYDFTVERANEAFAKI